MNIDLEQVRRRFPDQRWFGSKGRAIERVELIDVGIVEDGPPAFVMALVTVVFTDGGSDIYHLPLLLEEDGTSRDAFEEPDRLQVLGDLMAHGSSIKGEAGVFQFGGPGLDPTNPPGSVSCRVMGAEQSNTSLVLDEEVIVKTFRRVAVGRNPDLELTRLLTTEAFENIPAHVGEIAYEMESDDGEPEGIDLGLAQQFVDDAAEGWANALERLAELYNAVDDADVNEDIPFLIEERGADLLKEIEELGDATASLHVALSREQADPDLAPESIEPFDLEAWAASASASLLAVTDADLPDLLPLVAGIEARIEQVRTVEQPGMKTRIHGDYHLGQVICSGKGWMILDFEGEPIRSLEERRAKHSPLKDVAGMLRSLGYAASASLFEHAHEGEARKRLEPWALTWERLARDRFLQGYITRSHEGTFLPPDNDSQLALLDFFEIDKALYELRYELGHRPNWIHIPLRGIRQVIERGEIA